MSGLATEPHLIEPGSAKYTITFQQIRESLNNNKVCPKFLWLLTLPERLTCDHCEFKVSRKMSEKVFMATLKKCRARNCMEDVEVCLDYDCPKNIFYSKMNGAGHHENDVSRIARNCEWGVLYFFGHLTLEQLGQLYGLTRERIRQVEENALIKLRKAIKKSENLIHCGA